MSRIFISHSSKDNAQAVAIANWLLEHGWGRDDIFLDIDPHSGIAPGERWQRALNEAANRCEVVLFLISRSWLDSRWCLEELALAHKLNKRLFGVLIDAVGLDEVPARLRDEWQLIDLESGRDGRRFDVDLPNGQEAHATFSAGGLERLRSGLLKAGVDPRFFAWPPADDPDRAPYRGLAAMEAEDAGIFCGREAPIIAALDQIRGLAETAPPHLMVILGASGAGKSSFMRAGLIPRLRRDDNHFLVLPIVRPERASLTGGTGLVASLEGAARSQGLKWTRANVQKALAGGVEAVAARLDELAGTTGSSDAKRTIILPLDQAEELFMAEGRAEADSLLALLAELLRRGSPKLLVVATVRTDSYEELQASGHLAGISQIPFNLPALARGSYQRVIEGPAERLAGTDRALKIEPSLTATLLADIEQGGAKDALPLLAFTLSRLYEDHGGDGDLTLDEYEASGGIAGSIEAAVERALVASDSDPAVPRDRTAKLALLRRAMIPWLAGIDPETRSARRKVALFADIPEEVRPLVEHFVSQRLLSTDVSPSGERTVEPAHEALLRQWGLIDTWLKEDVAILATLEAVQRAARDWEANARDERWLAHSGGRLEDAETVRKRTDLARSLDARDIAYLDACRAAEAARHEREEQEARKLLAARELAEIRARSARRSKQALVAVGLMAVLAVAAGVYGLWNARIAEEQRVLAVESGAEAEQQRLIAAAAAERALHNETVGINASSQAALAQGRPVDALKLALAAWPRETDGRPALSRTITSMAAAIEAVKETRRFDGPAAATDLVSLVDRGWVAASYADGTVLVWDTVRGGTVAEFKIQAPVTRLVAIGGGARIVAVAEKSATILDPEARNSIAILDGHTEAIVSIATSPDGRYLATGSIDQTICLWNADGSFMRRLEGHRGTIFGLDFSPDSSQLASASGDATVRLWSIPDGETGLEFNGHSGGVNSVRFSGDGTALITTSNDKTARLWRVNDGSEQLRVPQFTQGAPDLAHAELAPDGTSFLVLARNRNSPPSDTTRAAVMLSQPRGVTVYNLTGETLHRIPDDLGEIVTARYMPTGNRIAVGTAIGTVRLVDATSGEVIATFTGHLRAVTALASLGQDATMVSGSADGTVRMWRNDLLPERWSAKRNGTTWSLSFSPDGRVAATGEESIDVFDAVTGARLWSADEEDWYWAEFSPDGGMLVAAARSGLIQLFHAATGRHLASTMADTGITYVSFSPDGSQLAAADAGGFVRLYAAEGLKEIDAIQVAEGDAISAEFSPDGRTVVAATYGGRVALLDTEPLRQRRTISDRNSKVYRATFSPDGRRIVAAFSDGTLSLWDAEGNSVAERSLGNASGAEGGVPMAVFSPDGRHIGVGWSASLSIWDAAAVERIGSTNQCTGALVQSVEYSLSGDRIAVGCGGSVATHDVTAFSGGDLAQLGCSRLGDNTVLDEALADYGLSQLEPICGDNPPLPVDWSKLR